ncbi:Lrp/AsnC family transcriptional regulator [Chelatococcus sp. SYSU_G07232]|uniref:Lrp/AsnC family transcriptional regulator n=1 Tax=Chelatococcus albus TaxID=3047466 RepID=A0ABT7AN65_9HYPH|nr:Lrp/AsnC family transcriptional regulator [Chelatococcus sp. SYSU_G07232]MDJ1160001.1 Lrp/AsnC family transcriptional regulator [Chelatococcus sp. SYSU_G07232]
MDEKNRQILRLLQDNARLPIKTIAGTVGLARSSVRERIARMEADGTIRGYRADVAPARAEDHLFRAFLIIRLARTPARDTVDRIAANPAVKRCFSISGEIDVIAEIESETTKALNAVRDEIASMPYVTDLTTAIVLVDEKPA